MRPNEPLPIRSTVLFRTSISREGVAIPTPNPIAAMRPITDQLGATAKASNSASAAEPRKQRPTSFSCPFSELTRKPPSKSPAAPPTKYDVRPDVAAASERPYKSRNRDGPKFSIAPKTNVEKKKKPKATQVRRRVSKLNQLTLVRLFCCSA